ncbi:TCR/Tet family MFS transporter [Shimia sp. CNT1-13L.2]|uniref:TCR/Tet family MFS transporter n=1 Tax=Shimia sp. CNT1-13L.2 TaxID=2959663 RepID=UPI0020CB85BF|nr:TCR/Tet family MFS transporter [Shimia sp. CNT1-13L.2]MCP9482731.1 TCR/Tet family MFS transporter [Shimia sp. CNT1-13L.2]
MRPNLPILFIFITVVIDAMGIGLIFPVMPTLIQEVSDGTLADAAIWGGVLSAAFALMQFLFGPIIGNLSDRYGRRPVLLVSLMVMAVDYVVMAVAGSIWLLLAGRIVGGITAATHSTASAYMADISKPEEKARNFGLIGAAFGVGFVLGPVLGGLLAEFGSRAPFWAAACLTGANALLGWIVLRETVTDKIRRPFSWKRANPLGALRAVTHLPGLAALLAVYFFYQIATAVYPSIWAYFTTERLGWSPGMIGVSLAAYGLGFAIVQGLLVAPSIRIFGNRGTVTFGLLIEFASLLFLGVVTSGLLVLAAVPVSALGALGMPALQAIMSRRVPDDAQGELQGVLTSLTSLATILAPLMMTQTFAYFTKPAAPVYAPGAPFILSACLLGIGLLLFSRVRKKL